MLMLPVQVSLYTFSALSFSQEPFFLQQKGAVYSAIDKKLQ